MRCEETVSVTRIFLVLTIISKEDQEHPWKFILQKTNLGDFCGTNISSTILNFNIAYPKNRFFV